MKTIILLFRNSMKRSLLRRSLFIIPLLASLALSPTGRSACQEGCLTNQNTVLGDDALLSNTTGVSNTAIGFNALYGNTQGINNTAIGGTALFSNTNGFDNVAVGYGALLSNTTGYINIAIGSYALQNNTTGVQNTAIGGLSSNTNGSYNTATGSGALAYNTTGDFNTASGINALLYNTTGGNNIALGVAAGSKLTTGNYNIDIGHHGFHGEGNTIRIGKQGIQTATFIAGVSGATVPTGVAVIVDGTGHLGTTTSSARFKEEIKPMDKASEAVLALKPVTFRYKKELDANSIPQFGLVAEDVEKVNPDLVVRNEQGKPYTVRYEAVNAMLLNEFLKEHRKGEQQDCKIRKLETTVEQQQEQIERLISALKKQAAQIQRVSIRLETSNSPSQVLVSHE
jgi:hypothetical protein